MKNLLLISLLVLAGCTQSGSGGGGTTSNNQPGSVDTAVEISKQDYGDVDVVSSLDPVIMATSATQTEASASFTIRNTSGGPLDLDIVAAPAEHFKIKISRCPSSLADGASCKLVVSFSNRGLVDGDTAGSLLINDGVDVPLVGRVLGIPDPQLHGIPHLAISSAGMVSANSKNVALIIKNDGSGNAHNLEFEHVGYHKRLNRCPAILLVNQSCVVELGPDNRNAPLARANVTVSAKSGADSNLPVNYMVDPKDPRFVLEDISFSDDGKHIVVSGQHLDTTVTAKAYDADHNLLGTLIQDGYSASTGHQEIMFTPSSADVSLPNTKFTLELVK